MSAHTPGPWAVVPDRKGFLEVHDFDEDGQPGDLIATVWHDMPTAQLVAAAPDLLAAASVALQTLAPCKDDDFVWAAMAQLHNAIAKATGA